MFRRIVKEHSIHETRRKLYIVSYSSITTNPRFSYLSVVFDTYIFSSEGYYHRSLSKYLFYFVSSMIPPTIVNLFFFCYLFCKVRYPFYIHTVTRSILLPSLLFTQTNLLPKIFLLSSIPVSSSYLDLVLVEKLKSYS